MSQIQSIKEATNIVDVIRQRVPLQSAGKNWKGLCPFHSEKSPSFFVSEELQRYKCFGCGASGDVLTFLQQVEGLTFAEALQTLAERAGITLEKSQFSPADDQRKRWFDILELAKSYYHFLLTEHELGAPAREYLAQRGLNAQSIKLFQIGYAPPGWDTSLKYFVAKKKYQAKELQEVGLAIAGKHGRVYDRFRDRLMFPLRDHRGRVVGFSGRILPTHAIKEPTDHSPGKITTSPKTPRSKTTIIPQPSVAAKTSTVALPTKDEPKYINTPETELYHKSQLLYGLFELHRSIRDERAVIVVEGELDVISSAQVGVNHVVAVKGSALTQDHVRLLERTVDHLILSFDRDQAGLAATQRAIELTKGSRLELRVLHVPPEYVGKDPDDLARQHPEVWRAIVKKTQSVYDFLIEYACHQFGTRDAGSKKKVSQWLAPWFRSLDSAVESEYYTQQLAKKLEISAEALRKDLLRWRSSPPNSQTASATLPSQLPATSSPAINKLLNTPEGYGVFLALHAEMTATFATQLRDLLSLTSDQPVLHALVSSLSQLCAQEKPSVTKTAELLPRILDQLGEDQRTVVTTLHLHPTYLELIQQFSPSSEWQRVFVQLQKRHAQRQRLELIERLKVLESMSERTPEQDQELESTLSLLAHQPKTP